MGWNNIDQQSMVTRSLPTPNGLLSGQHAVISFVFVFNGFDFVTFLVMILKGSLFFFFKKIVILIILAFDPTRDMRFGRSDF